MEMFGRARDIYGRVLDDARAAVLDKHERLLVGPQGASVRIAERDGAVLNFCANNYLGLSDDAAVVRAAHTALDRYGFGLSSVRFICGTQDAHTRLESELSAFVGADAAILYSSCFDANGGLFEALLGEDDVVISDELNHASIIDGIRLCKAERLRYPHGDLEGLREMLRQTSSKRLRLIATDGVFSMDGDLAPLDGICDLADEFDAMVMVDDSHATGFVGPTGRGTPEHWGVKGRVDIVTSTLGKALGGASGGFVAARREIVEVLRRRSRPYLFSNSLAPPVVCASLTVLAILASGPLGADLRGRVMENAARFRSGMTAAGFRIKPGFHPIVAVMMSGPRAADGGDATLARDVAEAMLDEGIYVVGFSFPVVPKGQARIRVQLSAAHTADMVDSAVNAFIRVGKRLSLL